MPRPARPPWMLQDWSRHIAAEDVIAVEKPILFNYDDDIGEQQDVANDHPDAVKRLRDLAEGARHDRVRIPWRVQLFPG